MSQSKVMLKKKKMMTTLLNLPLKSQSLILKMTQRKMTEKKKVKQNKKTSRMMRMLKLRNFTLSIESLWKGKGLHLSLKRTGRPEVLMRNSN